LVLRECDGQPLKLSWLPHRTLALVFWCIGSPEATARQLQAAAEVIQIAKYQGLEVLWVNLGDSRGATGRFWRQHRMAGQVVVEPQAPISPLAVAYGVRTTPTLLLVDAERAAVQRLAGPLSSRSVTKALEAVGYRVSMPRGSALLSGQVVMGDRAEEADGVQVALWFPGKHGAPAYTLYTDQRGYFELRGLRPGEYRYFARHTYPSGGGGFMFEPGSWHLRPGRNRVQLPTSGLYDTFCFEGQVPDIAGLTEAEAIQQLRKRGFHITKVLREHTDTVPPGHAILTEPRAGSRVQEQTVILTVSGKASASTAPGAPNAGEP
jgi:hypothetical protein